MHAHKTTQSIGLRAIQMVCHGLVLLVVASVLAGQSPASETRMVIVEGVGTDVESARKDAYRAAVRQVLGTLVDSETLVENDSLITDKVVTFSDGFVERVEPLPGGETREGALVRVRFKAFVRSGKMVESLLRANELLPASKKITVPDADSILARVVTLQDRKVGAEELFLAAAKGYPANCFKAEVFPLTDQNVRPKGDNVECDVRIKITARQKEYEEFAKRLITYLESLPPEGQYTGNLKPHSSSWPIDNRFIGSVVATGAIAARLQQATDKQHKNLLLNVGVAFEEDDVKAVNGGRDPASKESRQKTEGFFKSTGRLPVSICVVPDPAFSTPTRCMFFVDPNKCQSLKDISEGMATMRCTVAFRRVGRPQASESVTLQGIGFHRSDCQSSAGFVHNHPAESSYNFSPGLFETRNIRGQGGRFWLPFFEFTMTVAVPMAEFKKDLEVECTLTNGEVPAEPGSLPAK